METHLPRRTVLAIAVLIGFSSAEAAAQKAFEGLAGGWSGAGTIRMGSGATEPIRCRATYLVAEGGLRLQQDLVCASDSYKFQVKSDVVQKGDAVSGVWAETTRNVSGNLTGRVDGGRLEARVEGGGAFSAILSMATNKDRQSVTIRPQGGTEVAEVLVTLTRARG